MKRCWMSLAFFTLLLSSCTNADPKKMATDVCDCMDPAIGNLSKKAKKIMTKAFKDGDVSTVVRQEVAAIEDEEERTKVSEELQKSGKLMEGSKMQNCLTGIDKKYRVMKSDEKKTQVAIADELESQCPLGASIFKYGLKHKDDTPAKDDTNNDAAKDDETDPPKKKKTNDE